MNNDLPQVEAFRAQLDKLGSDYICNTSLPDSIASVLFLGNFQGEIVLWNMTVATLAHYRLHESQSIAPAQKSILNCPFIEIIEGTEGVFPLRVGLDLAEIDEPVIKKTIIMIRNYKRLVIGTIQFGVSNT